MEKPQDALKSGLELLKNAAQDYAKLRLSVDMLKIIVAVQFVGTNEDQIKAFVERFDRTMERLAAQSQQDISAAIEMLKHFVTVGKTHQA